MLNIVIPMAGRGSRFAEAGYEMPKPLIDVHGKYMIEVVVNNVRPKCNHRFIFLCLQEHLNKYDLADKLESIAPGCIVIPVDRVTEGAACTVLLAEKYIDNDDALMTANSDQYIDYDINIYLDKMGESDGLIMTMYADDPKWSFVKLSNEDYVVEVREKEVISNKATVGIYNFAHGSDYVKYAHEMINANERVNGEFYVAPVYNRMIKDGKRIVYCNIGSETDGMYGMGIPKDLDDFLKRENMKQRIIKEAQWKNR